MVRRRDATVRTFETFNDPRLRRALPHARSDPWLGLAPADAYPALEGDGLAQK